MQNVLDEDVACTEGETSTLEAGTGFARQTGSRLSDVAPLYALVSGHSQVRMQPQAELSFGDHVLNLDRCVIPRPILQPVQPPLVGADRRAVSS